MSKVYPFLLAVLLLSSVISPEVFHHRGVVGFHSLLDLVGAVVFVSHLVCLCSETFALSYVIQPPPDLDLFALNFFLTSINLIVASVIYDYTYFSSWFRVFVKVTPYAPLAPFARFIQVDTLSKLVPLYMQPPIAIPIIECWNGTSRLQWSAWQD